MAKRADTVLDRTAATVKRARIVQMRVNTILNKAIAATKMATSAAKPDAVSAPSTASKNPESPT